MLNSLFSLLVRDLIFLALVAAIVAPLCYAKTATLAVLKRNFVGYFSNPTGYVFLCLFVWLTSFAAFWPHEFFNANLANLDQLNRYLPYIMLIFVPAITMSVWAEERRQGTDELLLTLPAGDFDIVVGKYLAAAAIFTASLLFSQLCNFVVLASLTLGDLDIGLFFATYIGYWLVGMAMLSVGMVASFLTSNLTVGFILGALFNVPLVFAAQADLVIPSSTLARLISGWSISAQFDDFGRGVISLSSTAYFAMVVIVGLYLSMILIGARHWSGGRDGTSMLGHYLARTLALIAIALGVNFVFTNNEAISSVRRDLTVGRVSSLSPATKKLMRELENEHTVNIEAFISGNVPEIYAKTKTDLISMLKEFRAIAGGDKINVAIHVLDEGQEDAIEIAALAEERYGITAQPVRTRSRGAIRDDEVFLAAAFTCGLEKVVVPFFDYGIPVEYELTRSICTVAKAERKKVGIVRTPAQLFGGFTFAGGQPRNIPKQAIVEELEKQYDVEEIDPSNPIELDKYDVMLAVQPSALGPEEFDNVLRAVQSGQPTAIFEDPRPIFLTLAPPTGEPLQAPGNMGMFGGGQGPQPKGEIQKLWDLLGLEVPGQTGMMGLYEPDLAWQDYNPYLKLQIQGIPAEWVFCREEAPGGADSINEQSPITAGLSEIFFPVPGLIKPAKDSELKFTPLVQTGEQAGTISYREFMESQSDPAMLPVARGRPKGQMVLAARIRGPAGPVESNAAAAPAGANSPAGDSLPLPETMEPSAVPAPPATLPPAEPGPAPAEPSPAPAEPSPAPAEPSPAPAEPASDSSPEATPAAGGGESPAAASEQPASETEVPATEAAAPPTETPATEAAAPPAATETEAGGSAAQEAETEAAAADSSQDEAQPAPQDASETDDADADQQPAKREIDVVYVSDIDLMMSAFVRIRARPDEDEEINWNFENVTFLLNIIDVLSGDDQYIQIRRRKPHHSTLRMVELQTQAARDRELEQRISFQEKFDKAIKEAEKENEKEIEKFKKRMEEAQQKQREEGGMGIRMADVQKAATDYAENTARMERRLAVKREQLERNRDKDIGQIRRAIDLEILKIKNLYKVLAVTIPPIPPLLVGLVVFVRRRLREREGVSKTRMR